MSTRISEDRDPHPRDYSLPAGGGRRLEGSSQGDVTGITRAEVLALFAVYRRLSVDIHSQITSLEALESLAVARELRL